MGLPDIRVTVYNPSKSAIYANDASGDIGRSQLKYSDSPDGSNAAATVPLILRYEDVFARGYWTEWNIVEISSGDNVLVQNAPLLSAGSSQKYYVDSNWGFDPRVWIDDQVAYFWDQSNLTQRCPVSSIGFDNAPTVVNSRSFQVGGSSLTLGIPTPTAGNTLIAIATAAAADSLSVAGFTPLANGANGSALAVFTKVATGSESSVTFSSSASTLIQATVLEVANAGPISAQIDSTQSGPLLWSPATQMDTGALAIAAFAVGVGAGASTPRGWTQVGTQSMASTTLTEGITASAALQTITVASTSGLGAGETAIVGTGSDRETVTLTAVASGTIQALFSKNHASGEPVTAVSTYPNTLAVFEASATDTASNMMAATGFAASGATAPGGVAIMISIGVPAALTPAPWIMCKTSLNGGGTPAYLAGQTIVGRRRYAGVIQRRVRPNAKTPSATVTLTGMAEYLNRAVGNFAFTTSQNVDIGSAIFSVLNLFSSQWPFFTIDAGNFPTLGQTYDGTFTASTAASALSSILKAIASGDGWYLRVGHDFTPRLVPLYRDATDAYYSSVTLQQGTPPQAVAVSVTDSDVTQMYNRILVTGDTDPTSGVAVSAEVIDEASYAFYNLYFDGAPVQVQGLKTTLECERYAQSLLDQHSLAASSQVLTVYTRYNPGARVTLPGKMLQGDVLPPVARLTATGFIATSGGVTPPDITGLASVIVTTIECDDTRGTDSYQMANFAAMMPDWRAELAEQANAVANALATNSAAAAGIDQYFVDAAAYPPSIAGFVVTVPQFYAVFAAGSSPVQVGGNTFTVPPNTTARAWLAPNNTWTIVTDGSIVTGSIPYLFIQSNASGITGTIQTAQVGLLQIPASYLIEGQLLTPTLTGPGGTGSPTITIPAGGRGLLISQLNITLECTNQPTDGSLTTAILYYRQVGQTKWLQLATSPPRNATAGSDGNGTPLTGGAVSATGLYVFIYPEAANGPDFEFGFAYKSNRGTETAVESIGTSQVALGVPSGTTVSLGTATFAAPGGGSPTPTSTGALVVNVSVPFTISAANATWVASVNVLYGYYDPSFPGFGTLLFAQPTANAGLTGTMAFGATLQANSSSAPTYRYFFFIQVVAIDGSVVNSPAFIYTHA